jgi:hypothetical protein
MMFIEERPKYYPYIIFGLVPVYVGFCGLVYIFINYFGAFEFFFGLYLCFGAIACGALMRYIYLQ